MLRWAAAERTRSSGAAGGGRGRMASDGCSVGFQSCRPHGRHRCHASGPSPAILSALDALAMFHHRCGAWPSCCRPRSGLSPCGRPRSPTRATCCVPVINYSLGFPRITFQKAMPLQRSGLQPRKQWLTKESLCRRVAAAGTKETLRSGQTFKSPATRSSKFHREYQ